MITSDARHSLGDAASLAPSAGDDVEDMIVDEMLAIVASQSDRSASSTVPEITRDDIERIYREVRGDPSRVYDDVMTLLAIRAMRREEEQEQAAGSAMARGSQGGDTKLQWRELCHGLGLSECHEVFRILEDMPEHEHDAALSDHGGFFQNLLWKLEEEQREVDELEKTMALVELLDEQDAADRQAKDKDDEHPLEQLRRLFPDYKMHVIEDVYEAQGFDLDAAAAALANINAVSQVKSFASVLKASGPTTMWKKSPVQGQPTSSNNGHEGPKPAVESLGQFPVLPAKSKRGKMWKSHHPDELSTAYKPTASQFAAQRKNAELVNKRMAAPNAWNAQADGGSALEAKLTTNLKLERLQRLLPTIDRELLRTTFFLNNGSSMATEAALREIFNLPMPEQAPMMRTSQAVEDDDLSPVVTADAHVEDNPTYAQCRARVDSCWHQLSDRYVAALRSFNRDHHIIANERVRDITTGRRALREAQHAAAHAFVDAHLGHIRRHQALDLHGLTVVESLRVAREVIDVCRAERIRRCILICGVGNHSVNQKARLLTAIQLSLEHRGISFRKESGALYIYPLRSTS